MRKTKLRIASLCLLCTCICTGITKAHAQGGYAFNDKSKARINIHTSNDVQDEKNKLINVLKELNKVKGVYFMFSDQALGNTTVNTVEDMKENVEALLDKILNNTGLTYKKVNNNTFVIISKKDTDKPQANLHLVPGLQTIASEQNGSTAQVAPITGKVTDKSGNGVAGVTVSIKGKKKAVSTDAGGNFAIDAEKGDVLIITSVGFETMNITVGDDTNVAVQLTEKAGQLNEVVVTALGIQRKSKSLTYSTQKLSGSEVSNIKDANMINALAGKAAGVTITRSTSGVGGSARVILRGNKSTRENQPLYVIDGVPVANFSPAQPSDVWGQSSGAGSGGRDGGDGISNINPDDIENINILKGASASALYGSQAANGVILITTKKGKIGQSRLEYSTNYTSESILLKPALQYSYNQTGAPTATTTGTAESWGSKGTSPDHVSDFFRTGGTWINSLSFSGGNQTAQTYFSYSNTSSKGIMPTSKFDRHTINVRETLKVLNDKLSVDGNFTFITQKNHNRAVSGMYNNPLTGLYLFPRGLNFDDYKNNFEYFSPSRNVMLQNWWNINNEKGFGGDDNQQNPYWSLNRNLRDDKRDRGLGSLTLKYQFAKWLNVQARGSFDKSFDNYELKSYAGTQSVLAASNGRYTLEKASNTQLYGDLIATATPRLSDKLTLTANIGTSILDLKGNDRVFFDTDPTANPGLEYANKFVVSNIRPGALFSTASIDRKQVQSLFASTQFGFKDYLFLDLTVRNDWSSTLAFTPSVDGGFLYYSAGLTAVISDMVELPSAISFAKARISHAKVGNDIAPYATNPPYKFIQTSNGEVKPILNTKTPFPGTFLKPEDNRSFEIGTEWRFLNNKLGFDFTFYKNNNYRQYMEIPAPLGSGYSTYYLNLGNIQNTGIEAMINATPYSSKNLTWTSTVNLAANKNKIVKLSDASIPGAGPDNAFTLTDFGVNMFASKLKEGGQWGDIYTNKQVVRSNSGEIVLDADGKPTTTNIGAGILIGNPNPKFTLGWNNSFDIRKFTVSFLIDGRFGGKVMSVTQAVLDKYGVSEASASARDGGGVKVAAEDANGGKVSSVDAQKYYTSYGGRDGAGEMYIYDATNIRLRELAIGYSLPSFSKAVKEIRIGIVGRNLFFFKKKAPFDPETSMSTGNGLQGVDVFGLPSTRSLGVNLKFVF